MCAGPFKRAAFYDSAVPINQEVIADVGPSTILDVPFPHLSNLLIGGAGFPPVRACCRAVDD
jgi:hypothetical protein